VRKLITMGKTKYRTRRSKVASILVVLGLIVLVVNFIPLSSSEVEVENSLTVETIGENIGSMGENLGEAGERLGEAASEFGTSIGEAVGNLGEDLGAAITPEPARPVFPAGRLWPLLLIVVGLALILRRPNRETTKLKHDDEW